MFDPKQLSDLKYLQEVLDSALPKRGGTSSIIMRPPGRIRVQAGVAR